METGAEELRLERVGLTGIVLTKLDGTAKGVIALSVAKELGIPIRYVGVGEKMNDLIEFSPEAYINGLFDCHRNRVPVLAIAAQRGSTGAEMLAAYIAGVEAGAGVQVHDTEADRRNHQSVTQEKPLDLARGGVEGQLELTVFEHLAVYTAEDRDQHLAAQFLGQRLPVDVEVAGEAGLGGGAPPLSSVRS